MGYVLEVQVRDRWQPLDRYESEGAACAAFDREVERGTRPVRVIDGDGRQLVRLYYPGQAA